MKLGYVERFIRTREKDQIIVTHHSTTRIEERLLGTLDIKDAILNGKMVGIVEQDENLYRVWLKYKKKHDLNIIVLMDSDRLRIVTVFPSETARRIRRRE